jgi:hypothetical protein
MAAVVHLVQVVWQVLGLDRFFLLWQRLLDYFCVTKTGDLSGGGIHLPRGRRKRELVFTTTKASSR